MYNIEILNKVYIIFLSNINNEVFYAQKGQGGAFPNVEPKSYAETECQIETITCTIISIQETTKNWFSRMFKNFQLS